MFWPPWRHSQCKLIERLQSTVNLPGLKPQSSRLMWWNELQMDLQNCNFLPRRGRSYRKWGTILPEVYCMTISFSLEYCIASQDFVTSPYYYYARNLFGKKQYIKNITQAEHFKSKLCVFSISEASLSESYENQ